MIADMVNLTVMGVGFCHAASWLMLHRGFRASIVMTQKWVRRLDRSAARNISALLTRDF
jgi:hypothetical protein